MTKAKLEDNIKWAGYEGAFAFKFKKDAERVIAQLDLVRGKDIVGGKRFVEGKDLWNDSVYAEAEGDPKNGYMVCKFNDGPMTYLHAVE